MNKVEYNSFMTVSSIKDVLIFINDIINDNGTLEKVGKTVKTNSLYDYEGFRSNRDCNLKKTTIDKLKKLYKHGDDFLCELNSFIEMLNKQDEKILKIKENSNE